MKRLLRNSEALDVADLFASMSRVRNLNLYEEASATEFLKGISEAWRACRENPRLIYGKRTEALFAYVVGGLGKARLVKQEDSGDVYSSEDVIIPDYRVALTDGTRLLVEVKNFHSDDPLAKIRLARDYVARLAKYAELDGSQLKVAIYFSRWGQWTLLPLEWFEATDTHLETNLVTALARSEMAILGDQMVATTPDIQVVLESDADSSRRISDEGEARFKLGRIRLYCNNVELTDPLEKKLAFYFTRFSKWVESEEEALVEDADLVALRFTYAPDPEMVTEGQPFQMLGSISSMISRAFAEQTTEEGEVIAITATTEPNELGVLIPENYEGKGLPLWRMTTRPNLDFSSANVEWVDRS